MLERIIRAISAGQKQMKTAINAGQEEMTGQEEMNKAIYICIFK
jgi:hypothetical protein